jgi:hypothetical protein
VTDSHSHSHHNLLFIFITAWLGWADIQINSKLRRRVKRFVETLSLSQLSHLRHPLHASQPAIASTAESQPSPFRKTFQWQKKSIHLLISGKKFGNGNLTNGFFFNLCGTHSDKFGEIQILGIVHFDEKMMRGIGGMAHSNDSRHQSSSSSSSWSSQESIEWVTHLTHLPPLIEKSWFHLNELNWTEFHQTISSPFFWELVFQSSGNLRSQILDRFALEPPHSKAGRDKFTNNILNVFISQETRNLMNSEKIGMESLLRNDVLQFISLFDQEAKSFYIISSFISSLDTEWDLILFQGWRDGAAKR